MCISVSCPPSTLFYGDLGPTHFWRMYSVYTYIYASRYSILQLYKIIHIHNIEWIWSNHTWHWLLGGLQGLDYWLDKILKKASRIIAFDFSKHWKAETARKCKSSSLLLQPWIPMLPLYQIYRGHSTNCSPRTKTILALLEWRCSSPYPPSSTTFLAEFKWSGNPTNIWLQLTKHSSHLQQKGFLVFLCHFDAMASCLSFN